MKQDDAKGTLPPGPDPSPNLDLDQSWGFRLRHASRLRLDALDFTDLWEEGELGLDISEEEDEEGQEDNEAGSVAGEQEGGGVITQAQNLPPLPPPPPLAPPPPPPCTNGTPLPSKGQTLRLHWREVLCLPVLPRVSRFGPESIWAGLEPVSIDTGQLELLFQSKSSSLGSVKSQQPRPQCVSVLCVKRSNIVTIALSRLPPPHLIAHAIVAMDTCVLDREDIQRLQALVPSEEELTLIKEAQRKSPCSPLASAELCLLTLGSVPNLRPRLELWAFTLDYDTLEREIAEPLFHLKLAMEQLASNKTFRCILATVLAIGNFLNGRKAKGFELGYLGQLAQVRDTASRRPLLHHTCCILLDCFPHCSDLHSEISAVSRASKCDYSQVQSSLAQLELHCQAAREQLRVLEAGPVRMGVADFLQESEERLAVLRAVHRRVINRFHSFLLFLGYCRGTVREMEPGQFCKSVSDFALEYRAAQLNVLQQRQRHTHPRASTHTPPPAKVSPCPSVALQQHRQMEAVLSTPEPSPRLDLSLPRPRSKRREDSGSVPRRLKC